MLVNPADPANTRPRLREVETAARAIGLQIQFFKASTSGEIDMAFATLVHERADAFFVAGTRSSTAGASNWPAWQRAMRFLRPTRRAILSRSVD